LKYSDETPFPFEILCTHKLSRRLLPQLPSKGLRAIAGYFGHSASQLRRASHHISATAFIWRHLMKLLVQQDIHSFEDALIWVNQRDGTRQTVDRQFPMPREKRAKLPDQPGIYRMLRSNGDLLYIGKATSLKKRVNSYFHKKKRSAQARLTLEMLTQAVDLDVTVTPSALEAALLETDEIKRHTPPYNVALQENNRQIVFYSSDLKLVSPSPGKDFPIGPLPSIIACSAFSAIHQLLAGEIDEHSWEDEELPAIVLGMREDYAPPLDCFLKGVKLFKEQYSSLLAHYKKDGMNTPIRHLMALGKELRRIKLEELEKAKLEAQEEQEPEDTEGDSERVWEPEDVVKIICGIIRFSAHVIRRGRWFCLLSQSIIQWHSGPSSGGRPRTLVIDKGCPCAELTPPEQNLVFIPLLTKQERQCNFDVMTYDRMRVLTTELKRLVNDKKERHLQVQVGPTTVLKKDQLNELFKWV
jgi:DNA polymerase-3 subunit epsilon